MLRRWLGISIAVGVFGGAYLLSKYTSANPYLDNAEEPHLPFTMVEVAAAAGIDFKHDSFVTTFAPKNIEPFVVSDSAAVAVADYNNDGWMDFFVNNAKANGLQGLYRNNRDGTFTNVAEKAGLAVITSIYPVEYPVLGAFFFDYDNDGWKDLLVVGSSPRVYRNNGDGTFTEKTNSLDFPSDKGLALMVPAITDYDNDGFLDIILAHRWGDDMMKPTNQISYMPNSIVDATNGGTIAVFRNIGGKKFERVPGDLGMKHRGFGRSIGTYDIRGTGRPDVYFANDFSVDYLYFNEGGGKFRDVSKSIMTQNFSRNGMNADFADLDNDGYPVVFVSHIFEGGQRPAGNTLWKWLGGERFREISRQRGVNRCGWAWGGKFIDFDNNGHLDLIVGNGFISNNPKKSYWYFMGVLSGSDRQIAQDTKNWPPIGDSSLGGFQRACVFYNNGNGRFTNVAALTPLAQDVSDERGVAVIDYLNNGNQAILLSNQKQPMRLFRIEQHNNNTWIGFKLTGTKSNRDAYGAIMKVELADGRVLSRQLQTMNAYASQSDDRLHFGLGPEVKIKSVYLRWPSGITQEFSGEKFALNQYHKITEKE